MEKINLEDFRNPIQQFGERLFKEIIHLPKEIRNDDKERTGIQIVVRQLRTINLVMVSVCEPSELAKFFAVEKTVRTETYNDPTSQVSQQPEDMKFPGAVSYFLDENTEYHVSVSGLTAEEDTAIALILLSAVCNQTISEIAVNMTQRINGSNQVSLIEILPENFFRKGHYLYTLLQKYDGSGL